MAIRAVIDTNIWVSALLNPFGFPATLRRFFAEGAFQSVISESILLELAEVLNRPRIKDKYGLTVEDIRELIILIEERSEHVMLSGDVSVCRDKDDNLIIETALRVRHNILSPEMMILNLTITYHCFLQNMV